MVGRREGKRGEGRDHCPSQQLKTELHACDRLQPNCDIIQYDTIHSVCIECGDNVAIAYSTLCTIPVVTAWYQLPKSNRQ